MADYNILKIPDLGFGLDTESAENRLQPGYAEDIQNADPQAAGHIQKRVGYQGYAGNLPVRVAEVQQVGSTTMLCFVLDSSIDLSNVRSTPIVVKGRTSNFPVSVMDFPSTEYNTRYYPGFEIDTRRTFATGTNSDVFPFTTHNLSDEIIWTGLSESNSLFNNTNTQFIPDAISLNQSTQDITYTYTNGTGSSFEGFIYVAGRAAEAGVVYNTPTTAIASGTQTTNISAASHALNNRNILVKVFEDVGPGTSYVEVIPDAVVINVATGNVAVTTTLSAGINAVISLVSVPTTQVTTGTVVPGGSATITYDYAGNSDFQFVGVYLQNGLTLEYVIPDSVVLNAVTQVATVTFQVGSSTSFAIFWDYAQIISNKLCVTSYETPIGDVADFDPQLTIWGLDHSEIYGSNRAAREGWVSHIDSYNSQGENRLVAGLGGNIFSAQFAADGTNMTDHLMGETYPRLNALSAASVFLAPVFYDSSDSPNRTRGYITGTAGSTNTFNISSISYDSGLGWVKYIISVPSKTVVGTPSTIISTDAGMEDILTVSQTGWAVHSGDFTIKQWTDGVNQITIWVENDAVSASDFDEPSSGGFAGIFTDRLEFTGSTVPPFLLDDLMLSGVFTAEDDVHALNSQLVLGIPSTLVNNITQEFNPSAGLKFTAQRTSYIVPARTLNNTSDVTNILRGDMISYTEIDRLLRVKSVNPNADETVSISGDGTTAVMTVLSTASFAVGMKFTLLGSSSYNGIQTITDITSTTLIEFATTATTTESATLVGYTFEVDENLTFTDVETSTNLFSVVSRWIPVEYPEDDYNLTPVTRERYFAASTYSQQPIIRSTMVQDNMYLTNGEDEVFKFDGTSIYRAGLFRWQPNLFLNVDTTPAGKIVVDNPVVTTTAASVNNVFTADDTDIITFKVGDIIYHSLDAQYYTIVNLSVDSVSAPTKTFISVDRNIATLTSGGTLTRVSNYKYYFRLNAVDANNNVVASAVTGADDMVARLAGNAAVRIRLVGMPAWDIYDYARLDVQIYRTKSNSVAPFYKITTLQMGFDNLNGYIDYVDTDSDSTLIELDEVNTALKGAELGQAWTEPLRAKYITSADNRLILANIKDYPQLDIQLLKNNNILLASTFYATNNKNWLFRRDNTDTGTVTNMTDRVNYEFRNAASAVTVTGSTSVTNGLFTLSVVNTAVAGDWVYLFHSTSANRKLRFSGWWQIAVATAGTITISNLNTDTSAHGAADVNQALFASVSKDVPVALGADYNYGMLNGNKTNLSTDEYEFIAIRRLGDAINASMRKTNILITGYTTFKPWMIAAEGNEIGNARLLIRQPRASTLFMEVVIPALTGDFSVYVNSVKRAGAAQASAQTLSFPSRLIISYPNYPEIFDAPIATTDTDSDSAIDVNSADGQEITAIIPFFGDSAFGAALKSGVVVVFKTNSIYLVDLSAKARGLPSVQKLETRGKGCTLPYSVAVTRAGIMFANETGIYRLGHDLQVSYVGRKYERKWKENINTDTLDIATATHDTEANSYKLSYATGTDTENASVAVYNHTREEVGNGYGSWSHYTNHAVTGWANLLADAYFGSTTGRVFSIRKLGEVSDYRDDSSPVDMFVIMGATDFGDSGIRKMVRHVTSHFRSTTNTTGTVLTVATDLDTDFDDTDLFHINQVIAMTGLSDPGNQKIVTIQSSVPKKKMVYMQLKYANSTIDEPVILSGIDISVAGLNERGVTQAATTTR